MRRGRQEDNDREWHVVCLSWAVGRGQAGGGGDVREPPPFRALHIAVEDGRAVDPGAEKIHPAVSVVIGVSRAEHRVREEERCSEKQYG